MFVPLQFHLPPSQEKAEYDKHENSLDDGGYLKFLSRMSEPLLARVRVGKGLDFGCGPVPALARLLEQGGLQVALYDKFYYANPEVLARRYQFITSTEVVEHLAQPGEVLAQLWQLLGVGGYLGVMTKRWDTLDRFSTWHYKNDPTHISFFHQKTFEWLAKSWQAKLEILGPDVVFLQKLND